jgi:hypothetical protein
MPRYARNMVVMAKVETTQGTDAAPVAGTDAVLIAGNVDISPLEITYAERNLLLPYFGGSQSLLAMVNTKVSFSVELAGSGVAGTAPAWSALLQGCAMAAASLTTPTRQEFTPVSTALKSLSIYLNDDGVQHKLLGAMGNAKLSCKIGETPKIMFEFIGAYVAATAVALPNPTLTAWKVPLPMSKANAVDITIGCSYAAGALTGGTVFGSTGLDIDLGNRSVFFSSLTREGADITDRSSTCSFELELTAAQEVTALTDMLNNTTAGLGFTINGAVGSKIILFAPAMQRTAMRKTEREGVRMQSFDGKLVPLVGNDELRIVQL